MKNSIDFSNYQLALYGFSQEKRLDIEAKYYLENDIIFTTLEMIQFQMDKYQNFPLAFEEKEFSKLGFGCMVFQEKKKLYGLD